MVTSDGQTELQRVHVVSDTSGLPGNEEYILLGGAGGEVMVEVLGDDITDSHATQSGDVTFQGDADVDTQVRNEFLNWRMVVPSVKWSGKFFREVGCRVSFFTLVRLQETELIATE